MNEKNCAPDVALKEALRKLAEAIIAKYPNTVRATITLEDGCADLDIQQKTSIRYVDSRRLKVEG